MSSSRYGILPIVTLIFAAGCATKQTTPVPAPTHTVKPEPAISPEPALKPELIRSMDPEDILARLTLREKAAQIVMPWLSGSYAAFDDSAFATAIRWVDSLHVGGIIISIGSPLDAAAKLNHLQERSRLPLLIASDLEAGTAFRLRGGTGFPTNMGVAATGREQDAYEMGRITALEGRAVGIHLAFAPVADVNNNPANPIINTRSFGEDPERVARLVAAEIEGMQDHGMLATAKHFPGHGDTGTDSHIELPVINAGWERLDSIELVPFRAAIDADVAVVMSAHIALPAFDGGRGEPATVVPEILTGILRDSLDFEGLVVTDALDMGALVNEYGAGEAAVLALEAGADLLLQPSNPEEAVDAVASAVATGRITTARLDSSVLRILEMKDDLGLFDRRMVLLDSIPVVVGSQQFQNTAMDVTRRSIVLVKDSAGLVRSLRAAPRRLGVVAFGDDVGATLAGALRDAGRQVDLFRLHPASGPVSYDSARAMLQQNEVAIFATSVRASAWSGNIALPDAMAELIDSTAQILPVVLVSFGSPYIISQAPAAWSYLLGWSPRNESERAVADALSGRAPITGRLPASIPPAFPIGTGIQETP